jgi:hypothetical protein
MGVTMMTHPFALTIDDLSGLELLDQTDHEAQVEGGKVATEFLTLAHSGIEGGIKPIPLPHPLPLPTHKCFENGGPIVSTMRYPENGGPIPY